MKTILLGFLIAVAAIAQPPPTNITINQTQVSGGITGDCLKVGSGTPPRLSQGGCTGSGSISGTLTSGQVVYATGTNTVSSGSNLTWSSSANQFGVGPMVGTSGLGSTPIARFNRQFFLEADESSNLQATMIMKDTSTLVTGTPISRFSWYKAGDGSAMYFANYDNSGAFVSNMASFIRATGAFRLNTLAGSGTVCVKADNLGALSGSACPTHSYGGAFSNSGSAIVSSVVSIPITIPTACTIVGYDISIPATETGTATVKFLKVATGTASPGTGNSINTSGVSLSTGTHVHSTTTSDFTTTTVSANDVLAVNLTALTGTVTGLAASVECQ